MNYEEKAMNLGSPTPLFHGTSPESAHAILQNGFRLPAHAGMFGRGVYLAENPLKAGKYAGRQEGQPWWNFVGDDASGDWFHMLLCDVYLGKTKTVRHARPDMSPSKL